MIEWVDGPRAGLTLHVIKHYKKQRNINKKKTTSCGTKLIVTNKCVIRGIRRGLRLSCVWGVGVVTAVLLSETFRPSATENGETKMRCKSIF